MEAATLSAFRLLIIVFVLLRSRVSFLIGLRSGELGNEGNDKWLVFPVDVVEGGGDGRLKPIVDPLSLLFDP